MEFVELKNNPGNIRPSQAYLWKGQTEKSQTESFCSFDSVYHGYRAFLLTLLTYRFKHGITRVDDIISRWAPPSENNTKVYINFVCDRLKCSPSKTIDTFTDYTKLMATMTVMEQPARLAIYYLEGLKKPNLIHQLRQAYNRRTRDVKSMSPSEQKANNLILV